MLEDQAQVQAMAKAVLTQLNATQMEALKAELRTQLLTECQGEALVLARQELAEARLKQEEALQDRYARLVASWEGEIEQRIADGIQRGTRDLTTEVEDTITDLKAQRAEARQHRDQAQAQLVALVQQLLPPDKKVYLYTTGVRQLSLVDLNAVLARVGLVLKTRQTYSERLVACQTAPGRVEGKTLFWLEKATAPGVVVLDEDSDEADVSHTDSGHAFAPDRLALPEGTGA
jgi:hypothetical protein